MIININVFCQNRQLDANEYLHSQHTFQYCASIHSVQSYNKWRYHCAPGRRRSLQDHIVHGLMHNLKFKYQMDFKRHQRQSCLSSLEKKPENPHIELISLECRHGGFCTHTKTSNTAPKVIVYKSYIELSLLVQCKRQHMYSRYLY